MTLEQLNSVCRETFVSYLGINFIEIGDDYLVAEMPVDKYKFRPMGQLHGGASIALAETLAGAGSFLRVDLEKYYPVGIQVNANHIASFDGDKVIGHCELIHLGKTLHLWDVSVATPEGKIISRIRVTNLIKEQQKSGE